MLFNFANKIIALLSLKFWNFPSDFGMSCKTKKNICAVIYLCQIQFFKLSTTLLVFYRNRFFKMYLIKYFF